MATAYQDPTQQQPVQPKPKLPDPFGGTGVQTASGGWLPASHPGAAPYQAPAAAPGGATGAATQVPQGVGMTAMTPSAQGGQTVQTQFRDALLGQLKTDPNNVSLTDPDLAPQAQAFSNQQQRSQERAQQELAEQAFAGGTRGTGAYGAELGAMEQQRGEQQGAFNATLLKDAKTQRLESLFNAMGLAGQQVTADEALRVQKELGLGDLNIRGTDVANDYKLGQGNLGLGLLQALLQDRQGNNQLGLNAALGIAGINHNSALPGLK